MAFSGVRTFDGVATGGNRICSVVACTGDTFETCGTRFPKFEKNTTGVFEELSIVATVPTPQIVANLDAHDTTFYPATLTTTIMPLEAKDYHYEVSKQGDVTKFKLVLQNKASELYSFAIWGRVFDRDGQDATPPIPNEPGSAHVVLFSSTLAIVAMIFVFILN